MSGFAILDLVIGLVFIFFVLSIITSSVVEVVMSRLKVRSKFLTQWLMTIFDKKMIGPGGKPIKLAEGIMDHCLTTGLSKVGRATSFIDAQNFVSALIEKLTYDSEAPAEKVTTDLKSLLDRIGSVKAIDGSPLLSTELMRTFLIFGEEAKLAAKNQPTDPTATRKDEMQLFREKLEKWYDTAQERVSGRMKIQYIRPWTFWIGIVVAVALNVDTIQISKYLYDHKEEAKVFADKAMVSINDIQSAKKVNDSDLQESFKAIQADVHLLKETAPKGMPFGWGDGQKTPKGKEWLARIAGWLATVMAIMLGAPFWFDLLNKIANIRATGNKPPAAGAAPKT